MNNINNFIEKNFNNEHSSFLNINLTETLKRIVRIRILNTNFLFNFYQKNLYFIYDKSIYKLLLNKYLKKKFFFDLSFLKEILYFNIKIIKILSCRGKNQKYTHPKSDILYFCEKKNHNTYINKLLSQSSFSFSKLELSKFRTINFLIFRFLFDYYDLFKVKYDILAINIALDYLKPKLIIFIEGDKYQDYLISLIAKKKNIPTICLQWGILIEDKPNISLRNFQFDYYFSWGNFFSVDLKRKNLLTKFVNVGNFNYPLNKISNKKIVFFLQNINQYYCSNKTLSEFYSLIIWCLKNLSEKIIIRSHPQQKKSLLIFKRYKNAIIHETKYVPMHITLSQARICIGLYSSAVFEAACQNITSVFLFKKNLFTKFNLRLLLNKKVKLLNNTDSIKKIILKTKNVMDRNNRSKLPKNTKYFINKYGDDSVKYSNKIISNILKNNIKKINCV
jgi:hypothetical protein